MANCRAQASPGIRSLRSMIGVEHLIKRLDLEECASKLVLRTLTIHP